MISECVSRHGSKAAASFEFKYSPCDPNQKEALCPQTFFDLTVDTVPVGDVYYLGPSSTAVTPGVCMYIYLCLYICVSMCACIYVSMCLYMHWSQDHTSDLLFDQLSSAT